MLLLNGRSLSKKIKSTLSKKVEKILSIGIRPPHLVAILVGDNPASQTYVSAKEKACDEIGFKSVLL